MRERVVVWGTGNMGGAAIRSATGFPGLDLVGVVTGTDSKAGQDAAAFAGLDEPTGVLLTTDVEAALAACDAVAYMASGDTRPDDAIADVCRALRTGAVLVTPAIYPLYDPTHAPAEVIDPVRAAIAEGGGTLFVSGVDPGWGNDILPVLLTGVSSTIDQVRCQEIFDYSTYDQPDSVRYLVGMGQPMDYEPMMVAPTVPTMVWGGQVRLIARALGVELDDIRETLERRPLDATADPAEPPADDTGRDDFPTLVGRARALRPELALLGARAEADDQEAEMERAARRPQVGLSAALLHEDNRYRVSQDVAQVAIGVQWSLLDGGIQRHKADAAAARARSARERLADSASLVELEVRREWLAVDEASQRLATTAAALAQADENLRVTRDRYRNGLGTHTEVLDAEALRTLTERNHLDAHYDVHLARFRLKKAVGEL